ncbi:hypothetical protein ASPFODRAFT_34305 [Aspergillus luchuensis CBS 106.47]|uniref:Uncharacterized protein n=1 Tax=Aspergillus luchuensis (strain CBS 106.47) TaxID=1137211 RepID=A0A1M3TF94_ASPLC|nr:hypothetical protein ASPFODRAFT_34305 [Aspergillus luchuensis CBS 106.47]
MFVSHVRQGTTPERSGHTYDDSAVQAKIMRSLFTEQDDHDFPITTNSINILYMTGWQDINAQRYAQRKERAYTPDLTKTISTSQFGYIMCGCSHSTMPVSSAILLVSMRCAIRQHQRHELYIIFSIHSDTTIVSPIDWLEGIVSSKNLFLIAANGQHPLPQDAGLVLELFMVQAMRAGWLSSLFSRPSRTRLTTS